MGCTEGRYSNERIDFDFYGHQTVTQLVAGTEAPDAGGNAGDGHHGPVPHFRVILEMKDWQVFAERLVAIEAAREI